MAEALFNAMAKGNARAFSAGTQSAVRVNPVVAEVMLDAGLDIRGNSPKLLTPEMLDKAGRVITMGCIDANACPSRLLNAEDWGLPDPEGKSKEEIARVRDEIKRRVSTLLEEINKGEA